MLKKGRGGSRDIQVQRGFWQHQCLVAGFFRRNVPVGVLGKQTEVVLLEVL